MKYICEEKYYQKNHTMHKILTINPGSTSTKIAVYEDEKLLSLHTIRH